MHFHSSLVNEELKQAMDRKIELQLALQTLKKTYTPVYMSEEDTQPAKSRNPEKYTFLDKEALSKYTTDNGKILPRKYTGLTPMQQRKVSKLIKKSRHMQLAE